MAKPMFSAPLDRRHVGYVDPDHLALRRSDVAPELPAADGGVGLDRDPRARCYPHSRAVVRSPSRCQRDGAAPVAGGGTDGCRICGDLRRCIVGKGSRRDRRHVSPLVAPTCGEGVGGDDGRRHGLAGLNVTPRSVAAARPRQRRRDRRPSRRLPIRRLHTAGCRRRDWVRVPVEAEGDQALAGGRRPVFAGLVGNQSDEAGSPDVPAEPGR